MELFFSCSVVFKNILWCFAKEKPYEYELKEKKI